jgi:hypothetical protein
LKNNKEIVMAAVKNNGYSLTYASKELRNDKDLVLTSISKDVLNFLIRTSNPLSLDSEILWKSMKFHKLIREIPSFNIFFKFK